MSTNGPFLYPNVTSIPGHSGVGPAERQPKKQDGVPTEFDRAFDKALGTEPGKPQDLSQIRSPLKFSAHAAQRLKDRNIKLDTETMSRVNDAINKAEAKGIEDTLVLTNDAALIVSVKNRTVITALDKGSMAGNVFTNIDGAVIV